MLPLTLFIARKTSENNHSAGSHRGLPPLNRGTRASLVRAGCAALTLTAARDRGAAAVELGDVGVGVGGGPVGGTRSENNEVAVAAVQLQN